MAYFDKYGVEFSENGKTIHFPKNIKWLSEIDVPPCNILDLSECKYLELRERDLRGCGIQTIILPSSVEELPFYALQNCPNLRNVLGGNIKSIKRGALEQQCPLNNCPSLEKIQFSKEISDDDIHKYISQIQLGPENKGRHGFVVGADDEYSYIWCFNVRKFYYTKKDAEIEGTFVVFEHPIRREIIINNGICQIAQGDEWFVEDVKDKTKQILCEPYPGFSERRTDDGLHPYWVNVQTEAVTIYRQLEERQHKPLTEVVAEINQKVDSLNIEAIINAFKTTFSHTTHNKVGGDVREEFFEGHSSFYTDSYLETILPTYRNYSVETGYGYSLNNFTREQMESAKESDVEYRKRARKSYNKEEHKRFLLNEYIRKMVEDAKFVERCLWIESAKDMFSKTSKMGIEKVLYLNNHIRI